MSELIVRGDFIGGLVNVHGADELNGRAGPTMLTAFHHIPMRAVTMSVALAPTNPAVP